MEKHFLNYLIIKCNIKVCVFFKGYLTIYIKRNRIRNNYFLFNLGQTGNVTLTSRPWVRSVQTPAGPTRTNDFFTNLNTIQSQ